MVIHQRPSKSFLRDGCNGVGAVFGHLNFQRQAFHHGQYDGATHRIVFGQQHAAVAGVLRASSPWLRRGAIGAALGNPWRLDSDVLAAQSRL